MRRSSGTAKRSRLGEPGTAQRHANHALTLCRRHGFHLLEGQALLVLAGIGEHRGSASAKRPRSMSVRGWSGGRRPKGYADQARRIREEIDLPASGR